MIWSQYKSISRSGSPILIKIKYHDNEGTKPLNASKKCGKLFLTVELAWTGTPAHAGPFTGTPAKPH